MISERAQRPRGEGTRRPSLDDGQCIVAPEPLEVCGGALPRGEKCRVTSREHIDPHAGLCLGWRVRQQKLEVLQRDGDIESAIDGRKERFERFTQRGRDVGGHG